MKKFIDYLTRHPDGSYEPQTQIAIRRPDGNIITVGPGMKFRSGVLFMGIDIAQLLDKEVKEPDSSESDAQK